MSVRTEFDNPIHNDGPAVSAKEQLKNRLRARSVATRAALQAIGRREGGSITLSLPQQRLWLLDQILGPGPAYNVSMAVSLDFGTERRSWQ